MRPFEISSHRLWRRYRRNQVVGQLKAHRGAFVCAIVLLLAVITALLAPWLAPYNPGDLAAHDIMDAELPPIWQPGGDSRFWLGTDGLGRDLLSSLIYGLRTSLAVGFCAVLLQLLLGVSLGLAAGYLGGWTDRILMRLADLQLAFSSLMLAILALAIVQAAMGAASYSIWAPWILVLVLGLAEWPQYARTLRASVMAEKQKDYVAAAELLGFGNWRIMLRHILPNTLSPLLIISTLQVAHVILAEAALSFLGIGMPYYTPSLGGQMRDGFEYMLSGSWWIALLPGLTLVLLLLAINLLGDWLRDTLDIQ
ncbi:MAG: ABC transporter permease, partial [Gammaproteobacteria bacterium]|nr:ABC transporter permease [Gammaproteobacteria bacterium]